MAKTVNDAVNEARAILQDVTSQSFRYSTADLIAYLNDALLDARRIRPDLFYGMYDQDVPSFTESDLAEEFPIDGMYFTAVVFYMCGTAELRDDEFTQDGRAVSLLQQFSTRLLTVS